MFKITIDAPVNVTIEDCPECGLEAIDWRRAHGLPDASNNIFSLSGFSATSEKFFRRLLPYASVLFEVSPPEKVHWVKDLKNGLRLADWVRAPWHTYEFKLESSPEFLSALNSGNEDAWEALVAMAIMERAKEISPAVLAGIEIKLAAIAERNKNFSLAK